MVIVTLLDEKTRSAAPCTKAAGVFEEHLCVSRLHLLEDDYVVGIGLLEISDWENGCTVWDMGVDLLYQSRRGCHNTPKYRPPNALCGP